MSFRLTTLLWAFALLAAALATFGPGGIFAALGIIAFWANALGKRRLIAMEWSVLLGLLIVVIASLLPPFDAGRETARRTQCKRDFEYLSWVLVFGAAFEGAIPPVARTGLNGAGPQSWRVPLWDSPANFAISQRLVDVYTCPSDHTNNGLMTNYFAIVGAHTAWPPDRGRPIREITDGIKNSILLIEVAGRNTPWSKPADLTFDEALALLTAPPAGAAAHVHPRTTGFFYKSDARPGLHVAFVDGTVRFLALPLSIELATALLTVDGGEPIDEREFDRATEPQIDYARCYACALFALLALLPAHRLIRRPTPPLAV